MINYKRTDLAMEKRQSGEEKNFARLLREKKVGNTTVNEILLKSEDRTEKRYVTFSREKLWLADSAECEMITDMISSELRRLVENATQREIKTDLGILVAGLGNSEITADAIGPQTVKKLTVTRHLKDEDPDIYCEIGGCELSAISPGVLGQTGIETIEIIRGAVKNSEPDAIIAVDALAALSCERLGSVIQISDGGISPGSGIGNKRKAIDKETLGIPVISIGVPTVVESSTLVFDALENAGIKDIDSNLRKILQSGKSFFVTPSESDTITKKLSDIISESIMKAFVGVNI